MLINKYSIIWDIDTDNGIKFEDDKERVEIDVIEVVYIEFAIIIT